MPVDKPVRFATSWIEKPARWRRSRTVSAKLPSPKALIANVKDKGLVILTGCGHSGIVNILRYTQKLTNHTKIHAVIGGFHLSGPLFEPIIAPTTEALAGFADLVRAGKIRHWGVSNFDAAQLRDLPRNSHLRINSLIRIDFVAYNADQPQGLTCWGCQNGWVWAKLKPGTDAKAIEAQGKLTDETTRKFLTALLAAFKPWVERMKVKK